MEPFIVAALAVVVWCLAPLPLAVAIGRAFSQGSTPGHGGTHDRRADRTPFQL